jgi:hypothetical protein
VIIRLFTILLLLIAPTGQVLSMCPGAFPAAPVCPPETCCCGGEDSCPCGISSAPASPTHDHSPPAPTPPPEIRALLRDPILLDLPAFGVQAPQVAADTQRDPAAARLPSRAKLCIWRT